METFLHQLAVSLMEEYPNNLDEVLVVFNNRRSLRFFQRQFMSFGHNMFLPRTMAIDDLVAKLSGLHVVQKEFLLFELYRIHIDLEGEGRKYKTFDEFIPFGDLMIGDFSELDQYMVDARAIFDNLHDLKAIGEWNIEGEPLTPFQQDYLRFYHRLYDYYDRLRKVLADRGDAYSGMAYRQVAEQIVDVAERVEAAAIYFVGFNALSECERRIIGHYQRVGLGHLVVDSDPYYMQPEQEAGHFLRKHVDEFPSIRPQGASLFAEGKRTITIVQCPENVLQCKMAGQLLADNPQWLKSDDPESTAVVLADESLLLPALNSLPKGDYKINVSMGFPFTDSGVHLLVERMLNLHSRANERGYHRDDIYLLLVHPLVARLLGVAPEEVKAFKAKDVVRLQGAQLRSLLGVGEELPFFTDKPLGVDEFLQALQTIVEAVVEQDLLATDRKEMQSLAALVQVVEYLALLQHDYHYIDTLHTLQKIYVRIAQRHVVDLLGDPLSGLQLMGMLETRNLDFDRLLLLSASEDVLPSPRSASSLIPYELRRAAGLPTYQEKDSVYAFNFYHMLLRSREVYLLYSVKADGGRHGEPSRFLRQVEEELAPQFGINVKHWVVNNDTVLRDECGEDEVVQKSPSVLQTLRAVADKGFTPTGFDAYFQCKLRYYYENVLRIREEEDPTDDLDASLLGTVIHEVLQAIFTPCIGQMVSQDHLRWATEHLAEMLDAQFERQARLGRSISGQNYFYRGVAETQIAALLQVEMKQLREGHSLKILALEQSLDPILVGYDGLGNPIRLRGKVDRVDLMDGHLRIIDYKTGRLEDAELSYTGKPNRNGEVKVPGKWFQLMAYALLYTRQPNGIPTPDEGLQIGIYPLRYTGREPQLASFDKRTLITTADLEDFRKMLLANCSDLLDPDIPFAPTANRGACRYCAARTFCPSKP